MGAFQERRELPVRLVQPERKEDYDEQTDQPTEEAEHGLGG
jgi:hypothetical protein